MKATLSKDAEYRAELRVTFRLDKNHIANLLALHTVTFGDDQGEISEKEVMYRVKSQLTYSGTDALEFGADSEVDGPTLRWAQEQVNKFWKEVTK